MVDEHYNHAIVFMCSDVVFVFCEGPKTLRGKTMLTTANNAIVPWLVFAAALTKNDVSQHNLQTKTAISAILVSMG